MTISSTSSHKKLKPGGESKPIKIVDKKLKPGEESRPITFVKKTGYGELFSVELKEKRLMKCGF